MTKAPSPLALSLGDPAGIGPEIVAHAWSALRDSSNVFAVLGDADLMSERTTVCRIRALHEAAAAFPDALPVLHRPVTEKVVIGRPDPAHAPAILGWIEEAVALCLDGQASGLVTAPISKAPLYEAGFKFPGHTEYLADLTAHVPMDSPRGPVMMLTTRDLRVALATIHIPLAAVPSALSIEKIVNVGRVTAHALRQDFGIESPRLAIAGLNPHAGESGSIGREEIDIVNPAAQRLRELGIDCSDARPSDTLFHEEARRRFDGVIALYHDQALIPVKTLDFWAGVNVSLGLPIVRTSPDHGTGYDIAGQDIARADSLIAAIRLAGSMAARRIAYAGLVH